MGAGECRVIGIPQHPEGEGEKGRAERGTDRESLWLATSCGHSRRQAESGSNDTHTVTRTTAISRINDEYSTQPVGGGVGGGGVVC